jgi:hypothetical protein
MITPSFAPHGSEILAELGLARKRFDDTFEFADEPAEVSR